MERLATVRSTVFVAGQFGMGFNWTQIPLKIEYQNTALKSIELISERGALNISYQQSLCLDSGPCCFFPAFVCSLLLAASQMIEKNKTEKNA